MKLTYTNELAEKRLSLARLHMNAWVIQFACEIKARKELQDKHKKELHSLLCRTYNCSEQTTLIHQQLKELSQLKHKNQVKRQLLSDKQRQEKIALEQLVR